MLENQIISPNIQQIRYILALHFATSSGSLLADKLWQTFPDLEELFSLTPTVLKKIKLPQSVREKLGNPLWSKVDEALRWQEKTDQYIVTLGDKNYPPLLAQIVSRPLVLFVMGDVKVLTSAQIAIVGSRAATYQGLENAFEFGNKLAVAGLTVTSGLALGVDGESHRGALAAKGCTIAVIGSGLECIYPKRHIDLAQQIVEQDGAVISEFPLKASPRPENFPQRNRIISGLSLGTLVVEASERSGSLITARLALEQNREVFAIPGSIYSKVARGTNGLIRQGAKLVMTVDDVLQELKIDKPVFCNSKLVKKKNTKLDLPHKKLLKCIDFEPTSIEVIARRSGLKMTEIGAVITELELLGCVESTVLGIVRTRQ